jgi:hypothetical protein
MLIGGRKATRKIIMRKKGRCHRGFFINLPSQAPTPVRRSHREMMIPRTISFPAKVFMNSRITAIWVVT